MHLDELEEVVTMLWCLVVEGDTDISCCCLEQHFRRRGLCRRMDSTENQNEDKYLTADSH